MECGNDGVNEKELEGYDTNPVINKRPTTEIHTVSIYVCFCANPPYIVINDFALVLMSWISQPLYLCEWHRSLQEE